MRTFLTVLLLITFCGGMYAGDNNRTSGQNAVKISGDVLFVGLPLSCLTMTLVTQDWEGLKQGAFAGVTTLGVTYAFKFAVGKERPDGSNKYSFPSSHSSVTFASATFLQKRYGWKWGAPAYALAGYVGWSRKYANKHDWWDVVAGAAIGAGSAWIFTKPFAEKHQLSIAPVATGSHFGLHASMCF